MPTRMEEMAAKGMGAVKAVKATVEGLHGVFRKLAEEHGEVSAMLTRVKASSDADVRRELFPEIYKQLLSHEKGELRELYPEFEKRPELASMAQEHNKEANELERTLDELKAMAVTDEAWVSTFDKLVELVTHHVEEEENDYFPAGERVLGKEEAEQIQSRYEATRAELLREPS